MSVLREKNLLNTKIRITMKYTGAIIGILATICVAILALQCVIHCTFGIAVLFAIMAVVSGYMTYLEFEEID